MTLKQYLVLSSALALYGTAQAQQPASSPTPVAGQQQPSPADGPKVPTVRVRTDEVNVVFTVVDKDGRFVHDLKKNQFRILDNKLPARQVTNFEAQTNLPLQVGLLIDASNSIRDRFKFEQDAASEFLFDVIRPKTDRAFVLAFDEKWDVTQDFTGDLDKLRKGIQSIRAGGGTAMWDSIYYACRDKLMKEATITPVRRAIILVSDGDDNQSRVYRQEAVDMAQRAGVIVYAISTSLMSNGGKGDENLKSLAEATGGKAFFPAVLDDVAKAFGNIQEELRSQYSISYRPDQFVANGMYRPIQILTDSKQYKVRARKGYFVPRQ